MLLLIYWGNTSKLYCLIDSVLYSAKPMTRFFWSDRFLFGLTRFLTLPECLTLFSHFRGACKTFWSLCDIKWKMRNHCIQYLIIFICPFWKKNGTYYGMGWMSVNFFFSGLFFLYYNMKFLETCMDGVLWCLVVHEGEITRIVSLILELFPFVHHRQPSMEVQRNSIE